METLPETVVEILPSNPIRVETALSRYPVHRLAKHGDIKIQIIESSDAGETSIKWKVTYNSEYGQPGPAAYKFDTLVVNRRIEEVGRPIPRVIKLGSLNEICRELGQMDGGKNTNGIKKSIRQNASAFITAKIRYKRPDGSEKKLEADFTRYSVVFTGEELPDGRKADAVYIVLNDIYMQVINGAMTRPLDYDYLRTLAPAPQRFYELLSYQMYAAIKNDRPRAKLTYSDFCTHAPQTRHSEWLRVRTQMNKIYRPHKESGYIGQIDYQDTTDKDGKPDWIMLYQPGPKARAEFRAFTRRGGPVRLETEPLALETTASMPPVLIEHERPAPAFAGAGLPLVAELVKRGVTPKAAAELAAGHPAEHLQQKIEQFDWRMTQPKPPKKPAAWLVKSIHDGYAADPDFVPQAERERKAEAKRQADRKAAEAKRLEREQHAQEQARRQKAKAYWESLTGEQQAEHDAAAIAQADAEQRKLIEPGPLKNIGMSILRNRYIDQLLASREAADA